MADRALYTLHLAAPCPQHEPDASPVASPKLSAYCGQRRQHCRRDRSSALDAGRSQCLLQLQDAYSPGTMGWGLLPWMAALLSSFGCQGLECKTKIRDIKVAPDSFRTGARVQTEFQKHWCFEQHLQVAPVNNR